MLHLIGHKQYNRARMAGSLAQRVFEIVENEEGV